MSPKCLIPSMVRQSDDGGLDTRVSSFDNSQKSSSRSPSIEHGHNPHSLTSNSTPRGYKSLQRKPVTESALVNPKQIVGDGFSEFEAFPSGNVQVGKKRKYTHAAAGLGPLELTQSAKIVKKATRRRERQLDQHSFDSEGRVTHRPGQDNLDEVSELTASIQSEKKTCSPALLQMVEMERGFHGMDQEGANQLPDHDAGAQNSASSTTRLLGPNTSTPSPSQNLKPNGRHLIQGPQTSRSNRLRDPLSWESYETSKEARPAN